MTDALTTQAVDVYGPLVSRGDVVAAVIAQLRSPRIGLLFYVAERERRAGLPPRSLPVPPSPASYRAGLDFETYGSDEMPLIVVLAQPQGAPERYDAGSYGQWFAIQVGALVEAQEELEAIALADHYGIALTACIAQRGGLGGIASRTRLGEFPRTEFPVVARRTLARSVVTFSSYVQPVVSEHYSPWPPASDGPAPDPYANPGDYPTVRKIDLTLTAQPVGDGADQTTTVVIDQG